MANRMKEDEKNERIIRGLLKLPANRRCINCNNLGPQYVCTNFRTFICTNCSGIHREFTHRVKSVSMAKFTTQEVIALKEGGNERAKEIYFKEWDTQRHSLPDSSNIDRVRDFIKHVYVDRRYTGEKNVDRPPRAKQGDGDDSSENRSVDSYQGGSRSPPYDDQYRERAGYGGRSVPRSPGYDSGDYKSSPGRFEAVDEKRRDDRFGNGNQNRRFEDRALPDGVPKQGRSPNHQKEIDTSSPPMVRPVRDILGDDMPALRIGPPPKSNGMRIPDSQRTSSSSSMGSSDGGSVQPKGASSGSLIDFDADPEPAVPAATNQSVPHQTTSEPADGGNWASFDFSSQQRAPQVAANATTLESMLGQLSAPASVPGGNTSTLPLSGVNYFPKSDNGVPTMQQQRPVPLASTNQFTNALFAAPSVGAVNQRWGSPPATNFEATLTAPTGYPSQVAPRPPQEMNVSVPSQPPVEAKPVGRNALPEDLFASLYPLAPTSVPVWQGRPHPAMGYGMQYPTGATMATFPPSSKPSNPFDFMNEPAPNQASMFPSVASLQEALPNLAQPSLLRTADSGTPSSHWMPSQQLSYPSAVSQSPYMMQQVPGNMPQQVPTNTIQMAYQAARGPGVEGAFFGAYGMDHHQLTPRHSQPGNSNSVGGNPFG